MLYCEKCRCVSADGLSRCSNCRSSKLRGVNDEDMVMLQRADEYTASVLSEKFDEAGIKHELAPFSKNFSDHMYDSEVMPTDKLVFVRWADYEAAKEISSKTGEAAKDGPQEEFEEMSPKKRILVQIFSALAFIIVVMLVVFGADALANFLKGLFGIG